MDIAKGIPADFCLPGKSENGQRGIVYYNKSTNLIEVCFTSLSKHQDSCSINNKKIDIVLGKTSFDQGSVEFSLIDCICIFDLHEKILYAKHFISNHHFTNKSEINCTKAIFLLRNLKSYFSNNIQEEGLSVKIDNEDFQLFWTTHYRSRNPIFNELFGDIEHKDATYEVSKKAPCLQIEFSQPINIFDSVEKYIRPLQSFFRLDSAMPVSIEPISVFHENKELDIHLLSFEKTPTRTLPSLIPILKKSDTQKGKEKLLKEYFSIYTEYSTELDMFTHIIHDNNQFPETEFLLLFSIFESIHRKATDAKYLDEKTFTEIKNAILNFSVVKELSQDTNKNKKKFYDKLKQNIQYINEFSARNRFKDFFDDMKYKSLVSLYTSKQELGDLVDLRNNYTHLNNKTNKLNNSNHLHNALKYTDILKAFILVFFFKQLNMKDEEVKVKLMFEYGIYNIKENTP